MDEDGVITLVVVGAVCFCTVVSIVGSWVCPISRPRRISGYIDDDEVNLV
jgi:hypothetical protein